MKVRLPPIRLLPYITVALVFCLSIYSSFDTGGFTLPSGEVEHIPITTVISTSLFQTLIFGFQVLLVCIAVFLSKRLYRRMASMQSISRKVLTISSFILIAAALFATEVLAMRVIASIFIGPSD